MVKKCVATPIKIVSACTLFLQKRNETNKFEDLEWTGVGPMTILLECFKINFLVSSGTRTNNLKPGAL